MNLLESYRIGFELAKTRWELARADFDQAKQSAHNGRVSEAQYDELRRARDDLERKMGLYESTWRIS